MVAAMIPAAFARGAGAETTHSIAIVVIGGQTLCLLITLLITFYLIAASDPYTYNNLNTQSPLQNREPGVLFRF